MQNSNRNYLYIEILRIIACFFVIFNHTYTKGFMLFSTRQIGSLSYWIYMFISVFCKVSVPLFLMISGALLLGREDDCKKDILRIGKIVVILLSFSLFYYLKSHFGQNFNLNDFIMIFYTKQTSGHLWYLYLYITFLLSLPFLRSMVRNLKVKYYYTMIVLVLFQKLLIFIEFFFWNGEYRANNDMLISWLASNIVIYPCVGYFLHNKTEENGIKKQDILLSLTMCLFGLFLSCLLTHRRALFLGSCDETNAQTFHNTFILFVCIALFISVKHFCGIVKIGKNIENFIREIGGVTFGIYLLHMFFLNEILEKTDIFRKLGINDMIVTIFAVIITMVLGSIGTIILKKIPIVNRLI